MKFIGRFSLFCMIALLGFGVGAYANSVYLKWFYPNREEIRGQEEFIPYTEIRETEETEKEKTDSLPAGSRKSDVITCDTVLVIEEYDKNTDITAEHAESIPGKYIGMDRDSFVDAMTSYALSPPLEEQQRGLLSVEVLTFSGDKVSIRKNYQILEDPAEDIFYLVAENHYITVYAQDMQTIYLYTDIRVENLPERLQEEIIQKKMIAGESNLYHFLESYSS